MNFALEGGDESPHCSNSPVVHGTDANFSRALNLVFENRQHEGWLMWVLRDTVISAHRNRISRGLSISNGSSRPEPIWSAAIHRRLGRVNSLARKRNRSAAMPAAALGNQIGATWCETRRQPHYQFAPVVR